MRVVFRTALAIVSLAVTLPVGAAPAAPSAAEHGRELAESASVALERGLITNAIDLATQSLGVGGTNFLAFAVRGRAYSLSKQPEPAIRDFTMALQINPRSSSLYQARGEDHFRLGQFKESVADFDRCLAIVPAQKPYHWQRGISCYYAGQFDEGRKQFELHQTVNAQDVENAVWHFLCLARQAGPATAREKLIRIQGDSRVPMTQVHALFAGRGTAADVLAAAEAAGRDRPSALFYAHLYLGLYCEATGDDAGARDHIFKAAALPGNNHYMGDVARVHARLLRSRDRR